jgi:hydrogenase maturation factor
MIMSIPFKVEDNHIIFDNLLKKKIKPITCIKFAETPNSQTPKGPVMRTLLKHSVLKILIMI